MRILDSGFSRTVRERCVVLCAAEQWSCRRHEKRGGKSFVRVCAKRTGSFLVQDMHAKESQNVEEEEENFSDLEWDSPRRTPVGGDGPSDGHENSSSSASFNLRMPTPSGGPGMLRTTPERLLFTPTPESERVRTTPPLLLSFLDVQAPLPILVIQRHRVYARPSIIPCSYSWAGSTSTINTTAEYCCRWMAALCTSQCKDARVHHT